MGRHRRAGLLLPGLLAAASCVSLAPRSRTPSAQARVVPNVPLTTFDEDRCGPGSLALVLSAHGQPHSPSDLEPLLPDVAGRGVLSLDMLLAARARGFDAALVTGTQPVLRGEVEAGRPSVLMLRLLDAPGSKKDIYHYVVVDGFDPARRLFRFQFGDAKGRWAPLASVESSWKPTGHALLVAQPASRTDALVDEALSLERADRFAEAVDLYRSVLAVRPDSVRAWVNLGNVSSSAGKRDEAERAYRKALTLAPSDPDALNNLAWLLLEEGTRLEEAESLASRAAAQPGPDRPAAFDTLARIQLALERCEEAALTARETLGSEGLTDQVRASLRELAAKAESCAQSGTNPTW